MRIVFPLLIVVAAAGIGPWAAIRLAAVQPGEYARIIDDAHLTIAAFGGSFLMMVALNCFIDEGKEVDRIRILATQLRRLASIRGLEIAPILVVVVCFALALPEHQRAGGLGAFLYLEVLDASFSFDGVIGAFALTQNLFLIAIGLGIGAMYVRSMTIMLVEKKSLAEFRYLELGAFCSIPVLSVIMFAQTVVHVSEMITGLLGAVLVGLALYSSIRHNHQSIGN